MAKSNKMQGKIFPAKLTKLMAYTFFPYSKSDVSYKCMFRERRKSLVNWWLRIFRVFSTPTILKSVTRGGMRRRGWKATSSLKSVHDKSYNFSSSSIYHVQSEKVPYTKHWWHHAKSVFQMSFNHSTRKELMCIGICFLGASIQSEGGYKSH
jgi:hypothetical protein